jgi:hypothetical protein
MTDEKKMTKSLSVRANPLLCIHIFDLGTTDEFVARTADKMHGTTPKEYTGAFLPGACPQRSAAKPVPTTRTDVYEQAVELVLERVKATGEIGREPRITGPARVAALDAKGELVECVVRVIEVLTN